MSFCIKIFLVTGLIRSCWFIADGSYVGARACWRGIFEKLRSCKILI